MFTIKIGDKTTRWSLQIFPNGTGNAWELQFRSGEGWLGISLERNNDEEDDYEDDYEDMDIFPISTETILNVVGGDNGTRKKRKGSFIKGFSWCVPRYMRHEMLKNVLHGAGDTLTIICEITIEGAGEVSTVSGSDSKYVLIPSDNVESKCLEDMENVFLAGMFTDVTFSVQEKEFHCHKAVLAGRSTVFHTMFTVDMREKNEDRVEIKDIDADTFNEMIIFIYSGKAKNLQQKAANLLMAAEKYDLTDLKAKCEASLSLGLDVDNVLDTLVLADLHRASNLRDLALKFVADNRKIIMSQKEWREKLTKNPEIMADIIAILAKK